MQHSNQRRVLRSRKTSRLTNPPDGFRYTKNILTPEEESEIVGYIEQLPLKEYEFQGYLAKRRTMAFGWHYDVAQEVVVRRQSIPEFLLPLRERAAAFAGLEADDLPHALVTEYTPGTPIGWHRDRPMFEDVIGV